jgi:hypothetical protein
MIRVDSFKFAGLAALASRAHSRARVRLLHSLRFEA